MESCVIYCRSSVESKLSTDVSYDDQQADCEKYAREHGYSVFKAYRESHTGADLLGRPLIWQALDDIKVGNASILLVRNWDRLARKPEHQAVILYEVEEKYGGRVESALDPNDREDPMHDMTRKILAVVAEAERLNAVARMERGKRHRVERGELPGLSNPLYGFDWLDDLDGERTTYIIDTETGPVVIRIYGLAVQGQSLRAIARILNADHVLTPAQYNEKRGRVGRHKVGTEWSAEQVSRILSDRTYTGDGTAYRWERVKSKNGKKSLRLRPENDPKRVALKVPALIDLETWNAAQKAVGTRDSTGRPPVDPEATWLRLHVYCGVCGSRMNVKRCQDRVGKDYRNEVVRFPVYTLDKYEYECRNKRGSSVGAKVCEGGDFSIRAHLLDPYAYAHLTRTVSHLEPLRQLMIQTLGTDKTRALASMAESFEVQLAEARAEYEQTRRLVRQTTNETLRADLLNDAAALTDHIHQLETEYAEARADLDDVQAGTAWVDAIVARIKATAPGEGLTEEDVRAASYEDRRHLLNASGVYLQAWPTGWREDGKRVTTGWMWDIDPKYATLVKGATHMQQVMASIEGHKLSHRMFTT
jgi:DNA invertase Pin-like site-specific DNA recombinase